jgi:hypothetical protein
MKARTNEEDLGFYRRIREQTVEPRPMVIGLETEEEKQHILSRARNPQGTQVQNISVVLDLTKKTMGERSEIESGSGREVQEAHNRPEERNRNDKWLVVGRHGDTLVKG